MAPRGAHKEWHFQFHLERQLDRSVDRKVRVSARFATGRRTLAFGHVALHEHPWAWLFVDLTVMHFDDFWSVWGGGRPLQLDDLAAIWSQFCICSVSVSGGPDP
eukprot:gene15055-biopygen6641